MDGMVPNRLPAIKTFVDAMNIAWYALVVVPHNIESSWALTSSPVPPGRTETITLGTQTLWTFRVVGL